MRVIKFFRFVFAYSKLMELDRSDCPTTAPPASPPDPDKLLKGYRWPASRLTKTDMAKLTELREQTGEPITQLLHEAVSTYYRILLEE